MPLQNDALQLCTIWQDQKPLIDCPSSWDSTQVEKLIGQADAESLPELQSKLQLVSPGFHVQCDAEFEMEFPRPYMIMSSCSTEAGG